MAPERRLSLIAALALGLDLWIASRQASSSLAGLGPPTPLGWYGVRGGVLLLALALAWITRSSSPRTHGLGAGGPAGVGRFVLHVCVIVLLAYLLLAAAAIAALRQGWLTLPQPLPRDILTLEELWWKAPVAFLAAPLVEEGLYRGLGVPALHGVVGRRAALLLSGPLFYLLHLAYGYPPWMLHYLFAGWILAWAFLHAQRLWVPVLLHALGNVLMLADDLLLLLAPGWVRALLGPAARGLV